MAAVDDEEISSLPLPSGADNSRNDISDVGLMLLANDERLRSDLQVDGCVSESHAPRTASLMHDGLPRATRSFGGNEPINNDMVSDPLAHRSSLQKSRTPETVYYHEEDRRSKTRALHDDDSSMSEAIESLGRSFAAQTSAGGAYNDAIAGEDDEDDWIVPSTGILGDQRREQSAASLANAPSATEPRRATIDDAFAQPRAAATASKPNAPGGTTALGRVDFSQTERAMRSAATVGSYGELRSPARAGYAEQSDASRSERDSRSRSDSDGSTLTSSSSSRVSRSDQSSRSSRHTRRSESRSHRSARRRHRHSRRRESREKPEQTYAEFQESIRDRVKQQEDMEKREMLLLFYQKQQYEKAEVPQKFFREGLNSDLMEMRWWYYKLIRDTRINDEVADLKSKIVNGSRFALFLNSQIGNPLNLRLDKNFPKELANTLNTSTDRHLREHIKSKCGVSGPKPRPWSHILRDVWECGLNYHQNSLAMEESEKKRAKPAPTTTAPQQQSASFAVPPAAPPTFNAFQTFQQQVPPSGAAISQPRNVAQQQYERLLEQQEMQRRMFQGQLQQQALQRAQTQPQQSAQPNRAPLRNVFRNMSGSMREQPIPQHLRPPQQRASAPSQREQNANNVSLAEAARAMRSKLGIVGNEVAPQPPAARPSVPRNAPTPPSRPPNHNARPQPPLQRLSPATLAPPTREPAQKKSLIRPAPVPARNVAQPIGSPNRAVPTARLPRNNSLWSRLQNPPPHLPPVPTQAPRLAPAKTTTNAVAPTTHTEQQQQQQQQQQQKYNNQPLSSLQTATDTTTLSSQEAQRDSLAPTASGKRSLHELMQQLQSAHDEDDQSYENDEMFSESAGVMPDLPQDRFAETVALMEDFNNDTTEVDANARRMASLHDIDDVLGVSLSEVSQKRSDQQQSASASGAGRSRRRRKRHTRSKHDDDDSQSQNANSRKSPVASVERARTPSPQPETLNVQRGSGRASIGRSGRVVIEY